REGANVVICSRNEAQLKHALDALRKKAPARKIAGTTADVARSTDVKNLFEFADKELGGLDVLINNAGVGLFHAVDELTVEQWDQAIGTNLSGAFYCSREALPRFHRAGGGSIINISSLAGKNPFAGGAA